MRSEKDMLASFGAAVAGMLGSNADAARPIAPDVMWDEVQRLYATRAELPEVTTGVFQFGVSAFGGDDCFADADDTTPTTPETKQCP